MMTSSSCTGGIGHLVLLAAPPSQRTTILSLAAASDFSIVGGQSVLPKQNKTSSCWQQGKKGLHHHKRASRLSSAALILSFSSSSSSSASFSLCLSAGSFCFKGYSRLRVDVSAARESSLSSSSEDESIASPEPMLPERWDVVGLGQAMVDFSGMAGEDFLLNLQLEKGTRKIVNHEERGKVLRALDGRSFKASAGGSLSNTLVALARLGSARNAHSCLNVAMTGSVGSDPLGDFYRAKLLKAGVQFLSPPIADGTTGTVIVLTTPDAQRTMLSYQGMSSIVNFDSTLAGVIGSARILVVEGYLWEIPKTIEAIAEACEAAHQNGALVALTASDVSCVSKHRKQFRDLMASCADILFTNSSEARAICGFGSDISPALTARCLSETCPFVSVTDGARGSYIGVGGEVLYVSPAHCVPVDTCGAGDAYAAGILYGILNGASDLKGMGNFAARVAAVVVGQLGTRLRARDAAHLADSFRTGSPAVEEGVLEGTSIYNAIE